MISLQMGQGNRFLYVLEGAEEQPSETARRLLAGIIGLVSRRLPALLTPSSALAPGAGLACSGLTMGACFLGVPSPPPPSSSKLSCIALPTAQWLLALMSYALLARLVGIIPHASHWAPSYCNKESLKEKIYDCDCNASNGSAPNDNEVGHKTYWHTAPHDT